MTMDEYIRWLENRIAVLGTELEVLVNARKAIEMARGELDRPRAPRIAAPTEKPRKKIVVDRGAWARTLEEIKQTILVAQPEQLKSGEIIAKILGDAPHPSKRDRDRIYGCLGQLKNEGAIIRSPEGTWSLNAALTQKEIKHG